jgi:ABC-type antimicrobial peptide transport system permease subunit
VIDPFVLGHLRENPLHAFAKAFATALEVSLLLGCVGINRGIGPNPSIQRLNFGIFVCILLLSAFAVSFLFLTVARYSEVLEMNQEIGVLRVLGASTGFMLELLYQDTLVIAILGTGAGIILTFAVQWFVSVEFSGYLTLKPAYDCWPISLAVSLIGPFSGAALALPRSTKQGIKEALSAEE